MIQTKSSFQWFQEDRDLDWKPDSARRVRQKTPGQCATLLGTLLLCSSLSFFFFFLPCSWLSQRLPLLVLGAPSSSWSLSLPEHTSPCRKKEKNSCKSFPRHCHTLKKKSSMTFWSRAGPWQGVALSLCFCLGLFSPFCPLDITSLWYLLCDPKLQHANLVHNHWKAQVWHWWPAMHDAGTTGLGMCRGDGWGSGLVEWKSWGILKLCR